MKYDTNYPSEWLQPPRPLTSDIRAEVIALDPEWARSSRWIPEYEFTHPNGGTRKFWADYTKRGVYAE